METLPPAESAVVRRIASDLKGRPGPLLEVLHAIQAALGYVPGAAVPIVAEVLNLSRAEVHGVVTFYHYFRRSPPGAHTVSLCQAEACQSMGAAALAARSEEHTSELQSQSNLVCRLLLEKKNKLEKSLMLMITVIGSMAMACTAIGQ